MTQKEIKINYIEFSVKDIARSKEFYGTLFGWSFTDYGPEYCEFNDGDFKGGFSQLEDKVRGVMPKSGPLIVLYGEQLEKLYEKVAQAGAEITKPIFSFPGGRRFEFLDPDGYKLAIWSDD